MIKALPEEIQAARTDEISTAVLEASRSPKLFTLKSLDAMKHFKLRHKDYKLAQKIARSVRPAAVAEAFNIVEAERLKQCVVNAEIRYPLIHRKLVENTEPVIQIASRYPGKGKELTRCRVYQLKDQFLEYVELSHPGQEAKALRTIEALAAQ